ncbi:acetyltransferase [Adlercreutzia sp. ZJ242]|uniref:acetyltransferase n=1 Tax=Adlercreutzia sp. ZJ242 TaxID=2709409 RepID=UPI0013ECCBB5|nr:acetyltransferase [Adlercreutzia sp. ZJ242]
MRRLIIIGAGGHGKVVADIAMRVGYRDVAFLDDAEGSAECAGLPVVGRASDWGSFPETDFFVAIGDARARERIQRGLGGRAVTLVHPAASVSRRVEVGRGSVVMAGAVVNSDVRIGEGAIVNTGATVDHDCRIGRFAHVSVGSHVAGAVTVGDGTWLGVGSVVSNNVSICGGCMVGAGAVVVGDIEEPGTYVGVPARLLR